MAQPACLPALRGLRWLCVDVWRLIFQKPLLWLPVGVQEDAQQGDAPLRQRLRHALTLALALAVLMYAATFGAMLLDSVLDPQQDSPLLVVALSNAAFIVCLFLTFGALLVQTLAARGVPFSAVLTYASRAALRPAFSLVYRGARLALVSCPGAAVQFAHHFPAFPCADAGNRHACAAHMRRTAPVRLGAASGAGAPADGARDVWRCGARQCRVIL